MKKKVYKEKHKKATDTNVVTKEEKKSTKKKSDK